MKKWTDEEDKILYSDYPTAPWNELLEKLPGRGKDNIYYRAKRLGLVRALVPGQWTAEEESILREMYPTRSMNELMDALPDRSKASIYAKAFMLDLVRPKSKENKAICPDCGGAKTRDAQRCMECYRKQSLSKREQRLSKNISRPTHPKRQFKPTKTVRYRPWEKSILVDLGPRCTFVELRMLLPRRSKRDIYAMAREFGITLYDELIRGKVE